MFIYLASPYTSPDPKIMDRRFRAAAEAIATILNTYKNWPTVYSPVVHYHPVAVNHDLPRDFGFWERHNKNMIRRADSLCVLKFPGWDVSKGVRAEIDFAIKLGKYVDYGEPELLCPESMKTG